MLQHLDSSLQQLIARAKAQGQLTYEEVSSYLPDEIEGTDRIDALLAALREQVERWRERGDWAKLKCIELLIVRGWSNKRVAEAIEITEQQVANFKFDFLARMRTLVQRQQLSPDIFPELYQQSE